MPITPAKLSQFRWLARDVEALVVYDAMKMRCHLGDDDNSGYDEAAHDRVVGMLPELLALAATDSPSLKALHLTGIQQCTGVVVESCASLTRMAKLYLGNMQLGPNGGVTQIQCLTSLQTLEVRGLIFPQHIAQKACHHLSGPTASQICMKVPHTAPR